MHPVEIWRRLRLWLRRDRSSDDLDEEMRLHLELRARANQAQGMDAASADLAARRRFGNRVVLRDESRQLWGFLFVDRLVQDVRYAVRQLLRHRTSSLVAILTLALGIGANTSMFTLLNAVLFRPAPAADPDRLVWLATTSRDGRVRSASYPDYLDYRDQAGAFAGVSAFSREPVSLGGATPERVRGLVVSGNYFDVLGVRTSIGRSFRPDEDAQPGAHPVVVLNHALWTRRFGADPNIIDDPIVVNGRAFTVIGVAPPGFNGLELDGERTDVWIPMAMIGVMKPDDAGWLTERHASWLSIVGRLAPAVSVAQAQAAVATLAGQLSEARGEERSSTTVQVLPVSGGLDPSNRAEALPVFALLAVVPLLVLLVACANVANLLVARAIDRRKELAMRTALGATRGRLVRQLLTECVVLSVVAGVAAVGVSYALTGLITRFGNVPVLIADALRPDGRVLLATMVLAMVTGLVFGLAPAFTGSRPALVPALKAEGVSLMAGRRRHRLRDVFVIGQVTVSLVLLIVTGLCLQSLSKALNVDPGFDARHAATLSFDLSLQGYTPETRTLFKRRLLDSIQSMPGVESAALASVLPLSGMMYGTSAEPEGSVDHDRRLQMYYSSVTPRYFQTIGMPLVSGRELAASDDGASTLVVVVNETLARRVWPNENPIGKRLRTGGDDEPLREVVGVARDGKYDNLTEGPRPFVYLPEAQSRTSELSLVVRTAGDPAALIPSLRTTVQALDPDLPIYRVLTFERAIADTVDKQQAASSLVGVFGVLTLALAALGLYGVTAHGVRLRTKEIGIRMALGARADEVRRMFVREGLRLSLAGVAIGLVFGLVFSRMLSSFLFGLGAADALTFVVAAAVLCGVAALASFIPATRAAHVDPLVALRDE